MPERMLNLSSGGGADSTDRGALHGHAQVEAMYKVGCTPSGGLCTPTDMVKLGRACWPSHYFIVSHRPN